MTIKVRMIPHLDDANPAYPSGIAKVVEKYFRHLPKYGIEMVAPSATTYDLLALHASALDTYYKDDPIVAHCHGMYWSDDYDGAGWEHYENGKVIEVIRHARLVTVPSPWVAETFKRDMHFAPAVIPHAVDWEEWQGGADEGYILWNKNRNSDACDPTPVTELALLMPNTHFISTFANDKPPRNVRVLGPQQHEIMQGLVKGASIYLATTKETFGIGTLEALAAGVPVLAYDWGGSADMVIHGRTGYLAQPGNYEDLLHGATYITRHRKYMSVNARDYARSRGWDFVAELLATEYARTLDRINDFGSRPKHIDPSLYKLVVE